MCIDFELIDIDRISKKMKETPPISTDPILGSKPLFPRQWSSYPKWHGPLISQSLLELIRATSKWKGQTEFKFLDKEKNKYFYDNLVFNGSLDIAIAIECKRNLDQPDSDAIKRISNYQKIVDGNKKKFSKACGLSNSANVFFCVFDAYGPRKKSFNFPIIYPENLEEIFGSCVLDAWHGFEKTFYEQLIDLGLDCNKNYADRVRQFESLEDLKNKCDDITQIEDCIPTLDKIIPIFSKTYGQNIIALSD